MIFQDDDFLCSLGLRIAFVFSLVFSAFVTSSSSNSPPELENLPSSSRQHQQSISLVIYCFLLEVSSWTPK